MSYAPLTATDYLRYYAVAGLDSAIKTECEAIADLWVDSEFQEWERSLWQGASVPKDVQRAAFMIGAAEYILRDFARTNPGVQGVPLVESLRAGALEIARQSRIRGWLLGQDGTPQVAAGGRRSVLNVRLTR